jgi:transcriptional regulator
MYIPAHFKIEDPATLHAFMRQFSFATLVSMVDQAPYATHLPFLLDTSRSEAGVLRAHMARANPHWRAFESGVESLVIFQGPHAYISPAWYKNHPAVPTWNYAAVHAYGSPAILSAADTVELVTATVAEFDSRDLGIPPDYVKQIAQGVVAFEMEIVRLEGKMKMSQNRPYEDREAVIGILEGAQDDNSTGVAEYMARIAGRRTNGPCETVQ